MQDAKAHLAHGLPADTALAPCSGVAEVPAGQQQAHQVFSHAGQLAAQAGATTRGPSELPGAHVAGVLGRAGAIPGGPAMAARLLRAAQPPPPGAVAGCHAGLDHLGGAMAAGADVGRSEHDCKPCRADRVGEREAGPWIVATPRPAARPRPVAGAAMLTPEQSWPGPGSAPARPASSGVGRRAARSVDGGTRTLRGLRRGRTSAGFSIRRAPAFSGPAPRGCSAARR